MTISGLFCKIKHGNSVQWFAFEFADSVTHTVFENRVLRRISGPKRDEGTGEWRKLHNEELNDLYSSPSIVG